MNEPTRRGWLFALVPLLLLVALSGLFIRSSLVDFFRRATPPVEELTFERVTLSPGLVTMDVVNGGPDPVTVAQVLVDDAFWDFTIQPDRIVPRLGKVTIQVPYPWVEGETHHLKLLSSTGVTFEHEIAVATETPRPDGRFLAVFGLIGVYVGLVPVLIGLLWFPFLRQLEKRWLNFVLALTAGLLLFLGADAIDEALDAATQVAGAFQGTLVVVVGALGTLLLLQMLSQRKLAGEGPESRRAVAYLIAFGIGLHNLGEGLAIGAAYALGEAALGAFLMIGFMLHNSTEGLGIVAPIAKDQPSVKTLAGLGLLAGGPTVIGAWIGGLAYSPLYATIFLSVGAGAIAQVIIALYRIVARDAQGGVWSPFTAGGVLAGMLVMYATGLLVAA